MHKEFITRKLELLRHIKRVCVFAYVKVDAWVKRGSTIAVGRLVKFVTEEEPSLLIISCVRQEKEVSRVTRLQFAI